MYRIKTIEIFEKVGKTFNIFNYLEKIMQIFILKRFKVFFFFSFIKL